MCDAISREASSAADLLTREADVEPDPARAERLRMLALWASGLPARIGRELRTTGDRVERARGATS